ncbi:MAG: 3-hydroxyacyl-CoA dehydrogenase NAD-binding domain-containing protein, partial [Candidatus Krumholzibacteria bacterium]|nr:3-hydroxyacyl-CoA dehydrogenase NAD-binding domain-containing protein [Candidatus Krumholzibacteria bacterium]
MAIKKVAVIGAGTMGNGIAQVFAQSGFSVVMIDVKEEFVRRGLAAIDKSLARLVKKETISEEQKKEILGRVAVSTTLADAAGAGLVVEAAFEDFDVKIGIFSELDGVCNPDVIFASNTSSISITALAAKTKRPEKF